MNELDAIIVSVGEGFDLDNKDAQRLLNRITELTQERDEAVRQRELPFHDHNLWQKEKRYRELAESELATARAEAQHNADAAEALAGLERLGGNYALSFNTVNQKWDVMFWLGLNVWEINQDRPTYLAAVRAAEQAKGGK